jgi:hypothetical protein
MTPAFLAELPFTHRRFLKNPNVLCSCRDLHGIWLPEGEGIYRAT